MARTKGPLGWISPRHRTNRQHDAHAMASRSMMRFSLPIPKLAKGERIMLTQFWNDPDVVADTGVPFQRKHQLTGSCVEAGFWNAAVSTICAQRKAADKPTKAFIPFTYHNYALSRHYMGDDNPGEGSLGSTIARSAANDGLRDWVPGTDGMPNYTNADGDGFKVTSSIEMTWSSYKKSRSNIDKILTTSKQHLFGSVAELNSLDDIMAASGNGKGIAFACNYYVGSASIKGTGKNARVVGTWNGRGGHQQSIHGFENNEELGFLAAVGNNWDKNTYPQDPGGLPWCFCWVPFEGRGGVEWAMKQDGEVYAYSQLPWFEAMPKLMDWSDM